MHLKEGILLLKSHFLMIFKTSPGSGNLDSFCLEKTFFPSTVTSKSSFFQRQVLNLPHKHFLILQTDRTWFIVSDNTVKYFYLHNSFSNSIILNCFQAFKFSIICAVFLVFTDSVKLSRFCFTD